MAFSTKQRALLAQTFSADNEEHMQLLRDTLRKFNDEYKLIKWHTNQVLAGFVSSLCSSVLSYIPFLPGSDTIMKGALVYTGWHLKGRVSEHTAYQEDFNNMLEIYDWAFAGALPNSQNPDIQSVILTMGELVNTSRLEKLRGYLNQSDISYSEQAGNALLNGGKYLASSALSFFGYNGASQASVNGDNKLSHPAMELAINDFLDGSRRSKLTYYLYGEGGQVDVAGYFSNAWDKVSTATSQASQIMPYLGSHSHSQ